MTYRNREASPEDQSGYPRRTLPSWQRNRSIFTRLTSAVLIELRCPSRRERKLPSRTRSSLLSSSLRRIMLPAVDIASRTGATRFRSSMCADQLALLDIGVFIGRAVLAAFALSKAIGDVLQRMIVSNQRRCGQGPIDEQRPAPADPSNPISFGYRPYPAVVGLGLKGLAARVDARLRYRRPRPGVVRRI